MAVRVRVRVHMQESARTRTCCQRCVRVFVLCKCACLCGGKACGHVHARAEQRQVMIPGGVERHHAARGRVGERKRVGGGCDGSCYANSTAMRRACEIWGPPVRRFIFSETASKMTSYSRAECRLFVKVSLIAVVFNVTSMKNIVFNQREINQTSLYTTKWKAGGKLSTWFPPGDS